MPRYGIVASAEYIETQIGRLNWGKDGLLPAIAQDDATGEVLMLAWMNAEALRFTLATGEAHFWSRSRGELWHKGATSGNIQRVREIRLDCDADCLLLLVDPAGPACHTGHVSCFFRPLVSADAWPKRSDDEPHAA